MKTFFATEITDIREDRTQRKDESDYFWALHFLGALCALCSQDLRLICIKYSNESR